MLRATIIDDEHYACEELEYMLKDIKVDVIGTFLDSQDGFEFILNSKPDIVFLDVDMPKISGIELALKIQEHIPKIVIIFITAYSKYALDAYRAHPIDFLLKPIQETRLAKTILHITKKLDFQNVNTTQDVHINLFGKYGVVCSDGDIRFKTKKSFELLAYLLCNADIHIQRNELVRMLFGEDDMGKGLNNLYVTMYRLRKDLAAVGVQKNHLNIMEDYTVEIQEGMCDFIDFHRFVTKYVTVDHNNVHTAKAIIKTIKGSLLCGLDADWICEIREWTQIKAEDLIMQTALYYTSNNKLLQAEELLSKLIDLNPLSEVGYQQLLDVYIDTNQLQKYSYHYEKYVKLMRNEFECFPNAKYVKIAEKIFKSK